MSGFALKLSLALVASVSGYVNNFPTKNNAYDIVLPSSDIRNRSFAFMLGDYGYQGPVFEGSCQKAVADMMRAKRKQLERQGKSLLFVTALGDNFYGSGLKDASSGMGRGKWTGTDQWKWWDGAYENLTDVAWLGVLGNHDLGWCDAHATCPEISPRHNISGQVYASNQLDVDKGGHRGVDRAHNFHIPDFSYRYTINELNLEIYALDQNHRDEASVFNHLNNGPNGSYLCGKSKADINARLAEVAAAGEKMMEAGAAEGAYNAKTKRNVVLMQHYPSTCKDIVDEFTKNAPEASSMIDMKCIFGHAHDTKCESSADGGNGSCQWALLGAGGGCCSHEAVEKGHAGFGVLYFLPDGSTQIEQITSGETCHVQKPHEIAV